MWINFDISLFDNNPEIDNLRKLIQDLSYKHRYNFFIDIDKIINDEVFANIHSSDIEVISEFYETFIQTSPKIKYTITSNSEEPNCFNLTEAIIFFNAPFQIVLENNDNDGYFLDALIREFKNGGRKIAKFKNEKWLKYSMAGGADNIIHFIEAERKFYNNKNKFLKCFVIIDSDLEYPQPTNPKRFKLEEYLLKNNVPYHILNKREIENYLPVNLLVDYYPSNFTKSYIQLKPIQKDFIDLEYGFQLNRESLQIKKPEVHNLFSDLSNIDFNNLKEGLSANYKNFKKEFSKLFLLAKKEELIERANNTVYPNELEIILTKITKQL